MSDNETQLIRRKWNRNRILWVHGLGSALILGVAHSITTVVVAPDTFNIHAGLSKLVEVACASGLLGAFTYLAKSPLPQLPPELEDGVASPSTPTTYEPPKSA